MAIQLQTYATIFNGAATATQGLSQEPLDLTVGSPIRAVLESNSAAALWLQYIALQILSTTRLSTSNNDFVDSWVADFGLTRLPGTPATGLVLFTSFNPATTSALVPVGALVLTTSNITYAVYADTTNPAFDKSQNGYVRLAGNPSVTAPVQATVGGIDGNANAGVINLLGSSIPNIDTVSNPAAFTDGEDGETDAALRARFITFLDSLSAATLAAVRNAVKSVQAGLLFQISENTDTLGNVTPGNFVVVVDDGSGNPSDALRAAVFAAVDLVRPIGSSFQVIPPIVLSANVAMTLTLLPGANAIAIQTAVATAITGYLTALNVGVKASYSKISQLAYAVDNVNITNVSNYTLNGGTVDIGGNFAQAVRTGVLTIQ